jgi:Fur family peroxide stress response transcriptional regulator
MSPAARLKSRMEFFQRRCAECGLANTHQRQVLYRALADSDEHPSPEALYDRVKSQIPSISLGTVYRNIKIFTSCGLLEEVTPLHESSRLDPNLSVHHHLVCRRCQSIIDIPKEDIEPIRIHKGFPAGFQVERYEILGICSRCAAQDSARRTVTTLKKPNLKKPKKEKQSWEK